MMCLTRNKHLIFQEYRPNSTVPCWGWELGPRDPNDTILSTDCYGDPTDASSNMKSRNAVMDEDENETMTIILKDKRPYFNATRPAVLSYDFIFNLMASVEYCTYVELVGLELFIPKRRDRKQFKKELRRRMTARCGWMDEEHLKEHWRFYKHEDYKAHVGEHNYMLYTSAHQLPANKE